MVVVVGADKRCFLGFGRRLRDESDFPLLLLCALWKVISIQYVQAPHPYGSTMTGVGGGGVAVLRSKRGPTKASKSNWIAARAQRSGSNWQRDQVI